MAHHCMYGNFAASWTIADLPPVGADETQFFNQQNTPATSVVVNMGARGVELVCVFADAQFTCDLALQYLVGGSYVTALTFHAVSLANSSDMFAGGFEGVNLNGAPLKIVMSNVVNPTSGAGISVFARTTS